MDNDKKDFSIIIPVYNNQGSIKELGKQINEKIFNTNKLLNGEIIFTEDGSQDNSFQELLKLKDNNVKIIKFTRNFGQAAGVIAALNHSNSKCCIIMSADLQDPVELINDFFKYHFRDKIHIVAGYRKSREDSLISRIFSKLFIILIKKMIFSNYPIQGFDYVLISEQVKNEMLKMNESNPFWQGQMLWSGFSSKFIPYERQKRYSGKSQMSLSKKINYSMDGIFGFSILPIRVLSLSGILISICGFIYASYIILAKILGLGNMEYGWAPLMIVILLLSGFQLTMMGMLGEYLWRTLSQVQNRPDYIIDEIIE
jgi:polyisoprenyl-phosphate glycosyltransferase